MLGHGKNTPARRSVTIIGRKGPLMTVSTGGGGGGRVVDGDRLLVLVLCHCCR